MSPEPGPDAPADLLPPGSAFHHIGYACAEVSAQRDGLAELGYAQVGPAFTDPVQGVTGVFLEGLGPRLELLAPLPGSHTLDPWLSGAAKMYHLAYEVSDIDACASAMRAAGARVLGPPVPAVAFDQRRICFVMLRGARLLIELIEAAGGTSEMGAANTVTRP